MDGRRTWIRKNRQSRSWNEAGIGAKNMKMEMWKAWKWKGTHLIADDDKLKRGYPVNKGKCGEIKTSS